MRRILAVLIIMLLIVPQSYAQLQCAEDLDQSGAIDQPNETANCTTLANGDDICPISATQCIAQGQEACPLPGPSLRIPSQTLTAGTLSSGKCNYTYPCKRLNDLLTCTLTILPDINGQCPASHGQAFVTAPPDNGYQYANGICEYPLIVNGVVDATQYISVPLFTCDSSVVTNINGTDYCAECPLDPAFPCGVLPSVDPVNPVCSKNMCIASISSVSSTLLPANIADYRPAEQCTGVLRIFGGRKMRCRESGVQTGFNNCCSANDTINDPMGSTMDFYTGITTVKTVYQTVQAGYYAYQIMNGFTGTQIAALESLGVSQTVTQAAISGAAGATTTGQAVSAAMTNYLQATLLNPTTIAIGVMIWAVTQLLMGTCDQEDITTAVLNDSGYCHKIQSYCEESWPIVGCVQDANEYCCFNSKLARIVHEQARSQLSSFQPNTWSDCRGFTPEEFQMIDFSKIDFSEYFADIQTRTQANIQQNIQQGVQNYMNNVP